MQTIRLSTTPGVVNPGAYLSQYDVGRQMLFLLYDDVGKYIPAAGSSVHILATKPSGFGFDVACTWSQNSVTVTVTDEMSNESGSFGAELRIEKDGDILGTANFLWNVERSTHPDGTIDGNTEAKNLMSALLAAINDAETAAAAAMAAASFGGLTNEIKQALLNCFAHVAWIDDQGQTYYDALHAALYPPVPATSITLNKSTLSLREIGAEYTLVATLTPPDSTETVTWTSSDTSVATVDENGVVTSVDYGTATIMANTGSVSATCAVTVAQVTLTGIDAVFTQGGATIYNNDSLDTLKQYLVVTATYSDGSTEVLADEDYTLSGTLTVGTATITATYEGETDTFNVTVTQYVPHYAIVNNLTHVQSSNPTVSVEENDSFATSLGVQIGYAMQSVSITMGGVDITSSAYDEDTRAISIAAVTGNVVITAVAAEVPSSITAVFTQGSATIWDTDTLDSLKQYLAVTANYSGGTSETVPGTDYTLSGTLTSGTSTITVTYLGVTTTFTVTVSSRTLIDQTVALTSSTQTILDPFPAYDTTETYSFVYTFAAHTPVSTATGNVNRVYGTVASNSAAQSGGLQFLNNSQQWRALLGGMGKNFTPSDGDVICIVHNFATQGTKIYQNGTQIYSGSEGPSYFSNTAKFILQADTASITVAPVHVKVSIGDLH